VYLDPVVDDSALRGVHKALEGRGLPVDKEAVMRLPQPDVIGSVPLEKTIKSRRTIRSFASRGITLKDLSQILWAAQGIIEEGGFRRSVPSGGALYPIDVYAVVGESGVDEIESGVYRYEPGTHEIALVKEGDLRRELAKAALGQMWMAGAPVNLIITAEYSRSASKYGERGVRYSMIEAGHAGQNIFLEAEALGLGAGIVGAFNDREVVWVAKLRSGHEPLLLMPVGHKK
jgi:SagB-type dehydrogenase family enzyme